MAETKLFGLKRDSLARVILPGLCRVNGKQGQLDFRAYPLTSTGYVDTALPNTPAVKQYDTTVVGKEERYQKL